MRLIVPLALVALLVLPVSTSFSSESTPIVLGTVSRVLTTIDVNGDGRPDTISFDEGTRLFSIKGPGNSFGADSLGNDDRVLIWDFDKKVPGSGFIHLGADTEASNKSVTIYRAMAFRWDTKRLQLSYEVYITTALENNAGTPVAWYVQEAQQALTNWVARRGKSWLMIEQVQRALKEGQDYKSFLAKNAVIPPGSLRLLQRLQPHWDEYEEDGASYFWYGPVGRSHLVVTTVLEGGVFKLKRIKIDR